MLTGVSTSMRNRPSTNPMTMAHRHPFALRRFQNTPKKNNTKMGGASYPWTDWR